MNILNDLINELNSQYHLTMISASLFHISCSLQSERVDRFDYYRKDDYAMRQKLYARARQLREQIMFLTKIRDELTVEIIAIVDRYDFD